MIDEGDATRTHPLRNLLLLTVPTLVVCVLVAEVVLRVIVPAAEAPVVVADHAHAILRFDPEAARTGLYTIGPAARTRARWRINDAGWNSSVEYTARRTPGRPLVAIIGDSYIEAAQVDVDRNVGALLRDRLRAEADVYTIGISGAPLSQYLQMARYARREFHPDVLIVTIIHNDFDQSVRTLVPAPTFLQLVPAGDAMREAPPGRYVPDRLRRVLRHSALCRYLMFNVAIAGFPRRLAAAIRGDGSAANQWNANTDPQALLRERPVIIRAVATIVRTLRAENPGTRIVFVMDAPRRDIYAGTLATSNVRWLTALMQQTAAANDCEFVDLTPTFAAYWAAEHRLLNDPYDFHWNETAHRLVADTLLRVLRSSGGIVPDAMVAQIDASCASLPITRSRCPVSRLP